MEELNRRAEHYRELMLKTERDIWQHPETGYREERTGKLMEDIFRGFGYELKLAGNIPGFVTELDTGRPGPTLLILAELDSLQCETHPEADKVTHAVHACGHHAQCAAMVGIAGALKEEGALEGLSGKLRLALVPAEELIEIAYREGERAKGRLRYFGGKVEFLHRGLFDGCDLAFMVHTAGMKDADFGLSAGSNGCITKTFEYIGKASHAGGSPEQGINALYAAELGLNACNALRETFRDDDHIRFHPIIKNGGAVVNAIPDMVVLESYVRGADMKAIIRENSKLNRALAGAALSMGARLVMHDRPGYYPLHNSPELAELCGPAAEGIGKYVYTDTWGTGCTDMGDLSAVMPVVHAYCAGAAGAGHGADYRIVDPEKATVLSARFQLSLLEKLMSNGAAAAKHVVESYVPDYPTFRDYLDATDAVYRDIDAVTYNADGTAEIARF